MVRGSHLQAAGNPPGRHCALLPQPRREGLVIPVAFGPLGRVAHFFEDRLPPAPPDSSHDRWLRDIPLAACAPCSEPITQPKICQYHALTRMTPFSIAVATGKNAPVIIGTLTKDH